MEFSWRILLAVEIVNLLCLAAMFLAQQLNKSLPPRHSLIPGTRQRFLYMGDWYTMKYGDVVAVPLIANVFIHLVSWGCVGPLAWLLTIIPAIIFTIGGIVMCLGPDHKPDQGFPIAGKISLQGILHMPYFGAGWAMGLASLGALFMGCVKGPVLWLGIFGGVFYLGCLVAEFKSGNFDPLKKEPLSGPKPTSCYTCGHPFTDQNPDAGGGVCSSCWARSH